MDMFVNLVGQMFVDNRKGNIMAGLLRKHDDKLAAMYNMSYKEPSIDEVSKKFNNAKITNIRVDSKTSEIVVETSKGALVLGAEVDNGDPVILRGILK